VRRWHGVIWQNLVPAEPRQQRIATRASRPNCNHITPIDTHKKQIIQESPSTRAGYGHRGSFCWTLTVRPGSIRVTESHQPPKLIISEITTMQGMHFASLNCLAYMSSRRLNNWM
jgi:hypothetical protein